MTASYEKILSLLNSLEPDERRWAIESLANFEPNEKTIDAVVRFLTDENKGVRDACTISILSLARKSDETTRKVIAEKLCELFSINDVGLRNLLAEILVKIGKDAVESVKKLGESEDKDLRKFAVDIIGLISESEANDFLIQKLSDPDPNVIASAIEALGNTGDEKIIQILKKLFDENDDLQTIIVESIGKIAHRVKAHDILEDARSFLLEKFSRANDPLLKCAIIEAIGKIGTEKHAKFLAELTSDVNKAVQKSAIISLVQICARSQCEPLSNETIFKEFFEKAKEIFFKAEDEFKQIFLDFISTWTNYDFVKKFIVSLLSDPSEKTSSKAFEIILSNSLNFINYIFKNHVLESDKFVDIIEAVFFTRKEIFNDKNFASQVAEKLLICFDQVSSDKKLAILEIFPFIDLEKLEQIIIKALDDPDPFIQMQAQLMSKNLNLKK